MQQVAQGIASLGRGEDKMLVHMTPGEVAGLQMLAQKHGGSLTVNPHTGLPEAGFLSAILPMVGAGIGLALAPATGGASMWAMGGGALGGMLGSRAEGKNPLIGGLLGGISGYGMSGLADTFAGMGAGAAAEAGAAGSQLTGISDPRLGELGINTDLVNSSITQSPPTSAWGTLDAGPGAYPMQSTPTPEWGSLDAGPGVQPVQSTPIESGATPPGAPRPVVQNPVNPTWEGVKQAASAPVDFLTNPAGKYANAKNTAMTAAPLLAMGLGGLGNRAATMPNKTPSTYYNTTYSPGTFNPRFGQPGQPYFLGQGYGPGTYSTGYAEGGLLGGSKPNENQYYPGANIARAGQTPSPTEVVGGYDPSLDPYTGEPVKMADGGLTSLDTYAAGGKLLHGPGDGMSDSIPAVIQGDKPQRAALAQGEFVVPADVVSHLGNGSTDAGSKRLYAMMDKVRHARTGTKKQGKQINAEKFIPA